MLDFQHTETRINVKNNVDTLIFHIAICFGAKANSFYGI